MLQLASMQYAFAGDPKKALEILQRMYRDVAMATGSKGYVFNTNRAMAGLYIQLGDVAQAEAVLRRSLIFFGTNQHELPRTLAA